MSEFYFSEDHQYISVDGDIGAVGISIYAQEQLGEVTLVELPQIGKTFRQGEEAAVVESVKAASEIFAPVGGEVVEVNSALEDDADPVNENPEGEAWLFKIKIADQAELAKLMNRAAYDAFVKGLE